jgi:hypothetical protein
VIAREVFDKITVPLQDLFARTGPERLTLITCGGSFDANHAPTTTMSWSLPSPT